MKTALILAALIAAAPAAEKLDALRTSEGDIYRDVTVRKVEADAISIFHAEGAATIPLIELSEDLKDRFGYDPDAAAEKRDERARQRAERAEKRHAARQRRAAETQAEQDAEADEAFREKVERLGRSMEFRPQSSGVHRKGSTRWRATLGALKTPARELKGSGIAPGGTHAPVVTALVSNLDRSPNPDAPSNLQWIQVRLYPIGRVSYPFENVPRREIYHMTTSLERAVRFYREHGFNGDAANHVLKLF